MIVDATGYLGAIPDLTTAFSQDRRYVVDAEFAQNRYGCHTRKIPERGIADPLDREPGGLVPKHSFPAPHRQLA